jgi:hypothetical protein
MFLKKVTAFYRCGCNLSDFRGVECFYEHFEWRWSKPDMDIKCPDCGKWLKPVLIQAIENEAPPTYEKDDCGAADPN